jgi:hypothetical protein
MSVLNKIKRKNVIGSAMLTRSRLDLEVEIAEDADTGARGVAEMDILEDKLALDFGAVENDALGGPERAI